MRGGWWALAVAVAATGCAGTTQFAGPAVAPGAPTATLHVVRENNFTGASISAPVFVNRTPVGEIGPGGHLVAVVPAGPVAVTSTAADAQFQAEAGRTYYAEVRYDLQMWLWRPSFEVRMIDAATARRAYGRPL